MLTADALWSVSATAAAADPDPTPPVPIDEGDRRGLWWDLDLQFGYGWLQRPDSGTLGLVGGRGGVTYIAGSMFLTAGVACQATFPGTVGFGPQIEILHLPSGFWGSPGLLVGVDGRLALSGVVGWSLFGLEGRLLDAASSEPEKALLLRFRIPVSLLALAVSERRHLPE